MELIEVFLCVAVAALGIWCLFLHIRVKDLNVLFIDQTNKQTETFTALVPYLKGINEKVQGVKSEPTH